MKCPGALVAVFVALVACAHGEVLGVKPALQEKYVPNQNFACLDGRGQVAWEMVNDNFCDCPDGSDEPGTSACDYTFWCRNTGFVGKAIPSSMVNDGICDCCDGSDEAICENQCDMMGKARIKEIRKQIRELKSGLVLREERAAASKARYQKEVVERKAELEAKRDEAQEEMEREEALLDALDAKNEAARDALSPKMDDVKAQQRGTRLREDELGDDDEEWRERYGVDENGDKIEGETEEEEEEEEASPIDAAAMAFIRSQLIKQRTEEFKATYNQEPSDARREYDEQERKFRTAKSAFEDITKDLGVVEKLEKIDFRDGEMYELHDVTMTQRAGEYDYHLAWFESVKQGHTDLGKFSHWEDDHTVMKYQKGKRCWGGPDRSTRVILQCGVKDEVVLVDEPSMCEYHMTVRTPFACSEERLAELESSLETGARVEGVDDVLEVIQNTIE